MIKVIIFDCFGVLASDNWQEFHDKYLAHDKNKSIQATTLNSLSDRGGCSYDEWVAGMAAIVGLSEEQVRHERHSNVDNIELLNYIKEELNPQYKTAILSNVGKDFRADVFREWEETIFDKVILSCDIGLVKPDGKAFELAAILLDAQTFECIFVDDKLHNVEAAEAVGMRGLQYRDLDTFKKDLQELLHED